MRSPARKRKRAVKELLNVRPRVVRKNLRLGMMHYHLMPGGVASVMRDMASALRKYSAYETVEIDVFASVGNKARVHKAFECDEVGDESARVRIVEIPSLAYRKVPYPDRRSFKRAAERLAREVLQHIGREADTPECPYILHSHNLSLGKNPTATMAFKRIVDMASERSLPVWFINQVHDFAENNRTDEIRAFFDCTGQRDEAFARSFMYPNGPNVFYLTINSTDIENLTKIGISRDRIFLLPDPVDASKYEQAPLWEADEEVLAALELKQDDYRAMLLRKLADYAASKGQFFDDSLPVLLSPLKVMRRKNNVESLLLSHLFERLGRRYQLLITLGASSPPDVTYSRLMERFAASRNIPVVIGFGNEIISAGGERKARYGMVNRFNMCDLHGLSSAIITTSIVEGFGLAYHEGWLSHKPVIGRKIPGVVCDFENSGMRFDHMYDKFAVSFNDLPNLRERLQQAYGRKISRLPGNREHFGPLIRSTPDTIVEAKLFRIGRENCIDFADLSVDMQLELLQKLRDEPALASRLIDRNPAVSSTFGLMNDDGSGLIKTNRSVVRSKYSLQAMARRLRNLFEIGDTLYRSDCETVPLTAEDHAELIEKYRTPENTRLLF